MSNASLLSRLLAPGAEGGLVSSGGEVSAGTKEYATLNDLPTPSVGDLAFVTSLRAMYVGTDSGWYKVTIIDETPTITDVNDTYGYSGPITITATGLDPEGETLTWSYTVTGDTSAFNVTNTDNVYNVTSSGYGSIDLTIRASDGINVGTKTTTITRALSSSADLVTAGSPDGIYTYSVDGNVYTAYTDVTNGGWILYSSWANDNTFADSVTYPALSGNGITFSNYNSYGWTIDNVTAYSDSVTIFNFGSYSRNTGYVAFYASGPNVAKVHLSTFNGPTSWNEMKIDWRTNVGTDNRIYVNNEATQVVVGGDGPTVTTFDPTSTNPLTLYEGNGSIFEIANVWIR